MIIYFVGILFFLALYFFVGNFAGTKVKDVEDYYVCGRNAPTILIVGTLVASYLSTAAFMGDAAMAYDGYPWGVLWFMCLPAVGYIIGALLFSRYLRRSKVLTVAEFFEKRFADRKIRVVMGLTVLVGIMAYLIVATKGAAVIFSQVLGIPMTWAYLIVWLVYTSFTFYGGSQGVIITDTMMFILFTVAMLMVAPYTLQHAGGWTVIFSELTEQFPGIFSWTGTVGAYAKWPGAADALIWSTIMGLMGVLLVIGSPWQCSRYLMAKNEHVVIRSALIGGVSVLILYLLITSSAVAAKLISPLPSDSEQVFVNLSLNVFPPIIGIILLGGILSAALSSASTFLSLIGFSVTSDILGQRFIKTQKQELKYCRIAIILCSLISLFICLFDSPVILWLAFFAGSLFASSWTPVALMSVWCKWITKEGAFWGILLGFLGNAVSKFGATALGWTFPVWMDPFLIGLVLNVLAVVIVSRFTSVSPEGLAFRDSLFVTPPEYQDAKEVTLTKRIALITALVAILIVAALLMFYAIPNLKR